MTQDEVISNFLESPHSYVNHLIRTNELRHEARVWLGNYLLQNANPEYAEFSWIFLMPWYLSIDFTEGACNLDCRMCCGKEDRKNLKFAYVSRKEFRQILSHVPTASMIALPSNSSDPMMNPDILPILDILRRNRLPFNTVCNGHLLTPKIISAIASHPFHVEFNVSIDSHNPDKYREIRRGELQPVIDNMLALKEERDKHPESGLSINVMMAGMEDNIEDLTGMVHLCHQIGADKCKVQHLIGDNTPGDFFLNHHWQEAMFEAFVEGRRLGVELIFPRDALLQMEANLDEILIHENVAIDNIKSNEDEEKEHLKNPEPIGSDTPCSISQQSLPPKKPKSPVVCSRFDNLHIRFGGGMAPCCHVDFPTTLNIFDKPAYQNMDFLRYRLLLFRGDVFDDCHNAINCHCMQEYRIKKGS